MGVESATETLLGLDDLEHLAAIVDVADPSASQQQHVARLHQLRATLLILKGSFCCPNFLWRHRIH